MVFQIPDTIEKKLSVKLKIAMVVGSVVVLVGATFAGYYLGQKRNTEQPQVVQNNDYTVPSTDTVGEVVPDPITAPDGGNNPAVVNFPTTSLPQEIEQKIIWSEPREIANLKWFKNDIKTAENAAYFNEIVSRYYEVGKFKFLGETGKVLLVGIGGDGIGPAPSFHVIDFKNELVILPKYSDIYISNDLRVDDDLKMINSLLVSSTREHVKLDYLFNIDSLNFPKTIRGSNDKQVLKFLGVWYTLPARGGRVSPSADKQSTQLSDSKFGKVYTSVDTGGFYLYGAHGTEATYVLEPDFISSTNSIADIIWNDGTVNSYGYSYVDRGGCGSRNLISIVTSTDITVQNDLEIIGKTGTGDSIYELKNKNHRLLKFMYENTYQGESYDGTRWIKVSYEKFLEQKPLIFWVDPFGRLIKLENGRFGSQAECGKPVIYLYPEKTSVVDVKVEPQGGMTVSDPFYNGGWQVKAEPNGQLTEIKSGKQYPYLFWEGRGGLYQTPEKGFLMKKENIATELPEKLAQLGLNANEIKDFMEFWYPRMQAKPYYFVTFLGTQQMNQLAPLTINPRPDTVVRILMDFTPLDKPVDVLPLSLGRTPARKGFTVIEWGGVIR
jgi:hypothetical protein